MEYTRNGSISFAGRSINIKPGETFQINVRFNDMEPCPLRYAVPNKASGTVTEDGLYTAPNKEGSYEVRVTCPSIPDINGYVYFTVE